VADRPPQTREGDDGERHREPHGDRPVAEHRREGYLGGDAERDQHTGDATAHRARQRQRVRHLADEVREDDDRQCRRVAERVQHRPQHRGVERPVPRRAEVTRIARAEQMRGVADSRAEQSRPSGPGTTGESERDHDRQRGADRRQRAKRPRGVGRHESDRERRAGEDDRHEKHRVEENQERQQRSGRRGC
jgi:hypothetical protein